jgi:hypothetical protein
MLALVPDNPGRLAVDGGDDPSDLHLTLLYLGDDVASWPEGQAERLREIMTASAPALDAVDARVMGHAVLNPDGYQDREPCAVYLIGDTPDLDPLRRWAQWVMTTHDEYPTPPEQHTPTLWHVTAGYGVDVDELSYVGPVRFGTLRLALAGDVFDMPLGDQEAPVSGPQIKSITFTPSAEVRAAAKDLELDGEMATAVIEGKALDAEGLVWVAAHCGAIGQQWAGEMLGRVEVKRAGMRMGAVEGGDRPKLEDIGDLPADGEIPEEDRPKVVRKRKRGLGSDHHVTESPGSLEGAASDGSGRKDIEAGVEVKLMSPSPGAAKLREYWAHSAEGRAKWKPGIPGDFKRLRRHLAKYVHTPRILDGLTANIHKLATGEWPGKKAHTGKGNVGKKLVAAAKSVDWDAIEVKAADLVDVDLDVLHDGIDDWGTIFDDADVDDYLAGLGDPSEEVPADEDGARIARFAALNLVADDTSSGDVPAGDGEWTTLFDPPAAESESVSA